ncbi:MAG: CDP-diacylglycerol--glycerol-3-phosphate 3-phosphatidyltransferase [Verrucomicrobiota bacterium]|jgi:CDP-diacylglycerol--glycerol-3-phosphate 3-phosphatidyltransferase|nr:CDP-diacylglycerol--glycerol-3-phosphate 3-phosphatidyltransferase [Verrucomicrobiota bacterium]MDD8045313.1 CDP-diacylglycerol--glycerol-3-phosphate 3-phosphatidyltransferase [Verrucomicrobiota bacterium]MDI9382960.1 CDP-diacylglycerol--glycerol-3-phosphate 3-phosphatidyltransferase [Verrucomicrobiota bacterium]HCF96426.1 CDP-diacylglycerol--glycerol-3-phosphate 3-phosphatidyltransferase [Verrucomicrobiota bacterium]
MNLANKLTLTRILLAVLFLLMLLSGLPGGTTAALVTFIIASLTDYFDGHIARSRNMITNFGKLMDPLADKIMVSSAFIAFVGLHWIPSWIAVAIIGREFAVTGLRNLAASQGKVVPADGFGKAKTVSQIVAIITILVGYAIQMDLMEGLGCCLWLGVLFPTPFQWITWILLAVALVLTLYSGANYIRQNWNIIFEKGC